MIYYAILILRRSKLGRKLRIGFPCTIQAIAEYVIRDRCLLNNMKYFLSCYFLIEAIVSIEI